MSSDCPLDFIKSPRAGIFHNIKVRFLLLAYPPRLLPSVISLDHCGTPPTCADIVVLDCVAAVCAGLIAVVCAATTRSALVVVT